MVGRHAIRCFHNLPVHVKRLSFYRIRLSNRISESIHVPSVLCQLIVILIIYDGSAPKYHRLLMPCFLMPGIELVSTHQITDELCEGVDILYFNRIIPNQSINNVLALKEKHGFKIIVDFDDHWDLGPDHHLYDMYQLTQASDFMRIWIKEAYSKTTANES